MNICDVRNSLHTNNDKIKGIYISDNMLGRTPKKSSAAMCGTSRNSTNEVFFVKSFSQKKFVKLISQKKCMPPKCNL